MDFWAGPRNLGSRAGRVHGCTLPSLHKMHSCQRDTNCFHVFWEHGQGVPLNRVQAIPRTRQIPTSSLSYSLLISRRLRHIGSSLLCRRHVESWCDTTYPDCRRIALLRVCKTVQVLVHYGLCNLPHPSTPLSVLARFPTSIHHWFVAAGT